METTHSVIDEYSPPATRAIEHSALIKRLVASAMMAVSVLAAPGAFAQDASTTLIVAGPRTPESLDQEYPPTEAVHEVRRNINEPLLRYEPMIGEHGITYENFGKIVGGLAESWEVSPDLKSITFQLRKGVKSAAGNELTADDVMWTFERGWNLKANFRWYTSQVLNIQSFDDAFKKISDEKVQVNVPFSSPLLERLWTNIGLGILDSQEIKKHVTADDPWGSRWLANHAASYGPYYVTSYKPGQEVVFAANEAYYRGAPKLKKVIFREMPTSANRVAALQTGAVDVAEFLLPRELALLEQDPNLKVWKVFGNYVHRVEMNMTIAPFTDVRVRQAVNYLVPRDDILKSVYFGTARATKSPISEIYPGYTDEFFTFDTNLDKAKALLAEAGLAEGFKTQLGYRSGDQIEEEIAIILQSAFAKAGIELELLKLPASTLVERYTKGDIPMWFFRDMAIVPDAAYVANLWINSASVTNYPRYKDDEVDNLINESLKSTDEAKRLEHSKVVQKSFVEATPWVFLMNPGYQLATRSNVKGYAWYTPNSNNWYDFYKE